MAAGRAFLDAFKNPQLALMIGLGFSSGLPNPLAGDTLSAWLDDVGVSLTVVGLFGAVHLPYNFKFVWAPLIDRFRLPILSRRRGWMLAAQVGLLAAIFALGTLDPTKGPWLVAGVAFVIAFLGASQDIAVDAYRTELLPEAQRASGVAIFVMFYRVALLVAGSLALIVADQFDWRMVFFGLAGLMLIGTITTLIAPPPAVEPKPPASLREAVVEPFREFLRRDYAWGLLAIVMLYKFGDVVVGQIRTPFLRSVGFSLTEIGALGKSVGMIATILGALIGGGLVAKWTLKRAMIVFAIGQAIPNLTYALLAVTGKNYALMTAGYAVDNFMGGMGASALVAFLMTLCHKKYTATQYALFTSLMTVPGRLFGLGSGWLAENAGWPLLWVLSVVVALPAIALLYRVEIREPDPPPEASP